MIKKGFVKQYVKIKKSSPFLWADAALPLAPHPLQIPAPLRATNSWHMAYFLNIFTKKDMSKNQGHHQGQRHVLFKSKKIPLFALPEGWLGAWDKIKLD